VFLGEGGAKVPPILKKLIMKRIFIFTVFLILTFLPFVNANETYNDGFWEEDETWVDNSPGFDLGNNESVIIYHQVNTHEGVSLTFQNNGILHVHNKLIVYGDLEVRNNLSIIVEDGATLIFHGNVVMNNNATLNIDGDFQADSIFGNNNNSFTGDGNIYTDYYEGINDGSFNGIIHVGEGLPIELLYFNGSVLNGNVELEWKTATETNNSHFIIERSYDLEYWKEIARIPGSGNSNTPITYSYIDQQVPKKLIYYRLTQFDFDGKFEVFTPIYVNNVDINNIDIEIYDLNGRRLYGDLYQFEGQPIIIKYEIGNKIIIQKIIYNGRNNN